MKHATVHHEHLAYRHQAEMLRALAHPARLHLLTLLAASPVCVGELAEQSNLRQPYVSQHLATLREAGLVTSARDGLNVTYYLTCPQLEGFLAAIRETCVILRATNS